ncbi:unnamed protein product [Notodromas monacha]|uniref:Sulfotransferase n=1 Tax=Notodromas monacha TaxID=399045 RepID=A0A7R9BM77_9CRUS|nr:unnamed protein product [Notodromas monacha]CAG0918089.1 unnamed protein product [Notodromas monacha]
MRPLGICRLGIGIIFATSVGMLLYHSRLYKRRMGERDPWASRLMKIVLPKASKVERVSSTSSLPLANSTLIHLSSFRYYKELCYSALGQMLQNALDSNLQREFRYNGLDGEEESKRKPLLVLIVAYWRSGSSFLGELLNQYPGVFYTYEPFHNFSMNAQIRGGRHALESARWVTSLASCRYDKLGTWLGHVQQPQYTWLIQHNARLWRVCRNFMPYCFDAQFNTEACGKHRIRVVKTVRLRLNLTTELLDGSVFRRPEVVGGGGGGFGALKVAPAIKARISLISSFPCLGRNCVGKGHINAFGWGYFAQKVPSIESQALALLNFERVIHLVRDPRAMAVSREDSRVAQWCTDSACVSPNVVCRDMEDDIKYEDLGTNSSAVAESLFRFLGLNSRILSVEKFLRLATSGKVDKGAWTNPYSVVRDSSATVNAWKHKISKEVLEVIQKSCSQVLKLLDYSVYDPSEFRCRNCTLLAPGAP